MTSDVNLGGTHLVAWLILRAMAGIKQNGILGWFLRGSWLTSSEYLV